MTKSVSLDLKEKMHWYVVYEMYIKLKGSYKVEVKRQEKPYDKNTKRKPMWPYLFQAETKLPYRQEVSLEI